MSAGFPHRLDPDLTQPTYCCTYYRFFLILLPTWVDAIKHADLDQHRLYFPSALIWLRCCRQVILASLLTMECPQQQAGKSIKVTDLIDHLDQLHGGERLSCSILNGCQDLLFSLVPVADVVFDLGAGILNHRPVTCTEQRSRNQTFNRFVAS